MRIAICPGSFDPVTRGHLNIICRTAAQFDKVIVLVSTNPSKNPAFTAEERVEFIRRVTKHLPNVEVDAFDGLLAEYARSVGASTLVKGLRAVTDFEYEFQQALTNKKLNPDLETLFMITDSKYMYLSSSIAKEVARLGGDTTEFLPDEVREDVLHRLQK